MLKHTVIEENLAAFQKQAFPGIQNDISSWSSRLWVRAAEPLVRAALYIFFIVVNFVNGILSLLFWWSQRFAIRPLFTMAVTAIAFLAFLSLASHSPLLQGSHNKLAPATLMPVTAKR